MLPLSILAAPIGAISWAAIMPGAQVSVARAFADEVWPGSPDKHGLNIDELFNAIGGEFAPITTLFDPAKRQARIGFHESVDETTASLECMGGNMLAFGHILREDRCAQAKHGIVGHVDGFLLVW